MKNALLFFCLSLAGVALAPAVATAQALHPGQLELHVGADNLDGVTGGAAVRHVLDAGHWLGLRISGGLLRERFIGGYAIESGTLFEGAVQGSWLLKERGSTRFRLTTDAGARFVSSDASTPAGQNTLAITTDLVPTFEVDFSTNLTLVASMRLGIDLAVDPGFDIDLLESPIELGFRWWLTPKLALKPLIYVGGATGYNGDGAKHRLGARVGLAYSWDREEPSNLHEEKEEETSSIGAFVGLEWRGLNLANHISHGPGFRAGATFFGGYLKVGIAGLARPGPLTSNTFDVVAHNGLTYKGNRTLTLKSDGALLGLFIAGAVPVSDWITLEVPVTVGQAGFGFYLAGDDRNTPDGRRVSAWENELQDSRDAFIGLGIDTGVRVFLTPPTTPWFRPNIGVHYTFIPGYDAFAANDYSGFSAVVGTELGIF